MKIVDKTDLTDNQQVNTGITNEAEKEEKVGFEANDAKAAQIAEIEQFKRRMLEMEALEDEMLQSFMPALTEEKLKKVAKPEIETLVP